jgi:hypothetical protein
VPTWRRSYVRVGSKLGRPPTSAPDDASALVALVQRQPDATTAEHGTSQATDGKVAISLDDIAPEIEVANAPRVYRLSPELAAAAGTSNDDFVVQGLAARRHISLLAVLPKGGKTTWTAQMVVAALRGEPFLGKATDLAENEDILWLTEEPEDIFVPRLTEDFGVTEAEMGRILPAFRRRAPITYDWTKYLTALNAEVKAREQRTGRRIGLVIIDTFAAWTDLDDDTESKPGAVLKAFEPLYRLTESIGAGVVVLHHTRKSGGRFGTGIRGSGAIAGAVDVLVEMERWGGRNPPPTRRDIHVLGRRKATCWDASLDFRDGRYVVTEAKPRDADRGLGEVARRVLTALAKAGDDGRERKVLANEVGVSLSAIKKHVPELDTAGWVRADVGARGKETLHITDAGRERLAR